MSITANIEQWRAYINSSALLSPGLLRNYLYDAIAALEASERRAEEAERRLGKLAETIKECLYEDEYPSIYAAMKEATRG